MCLVGGVKMLLREELKAKLDAGEKLVLLNVLSRESFERVRLPNSVNIPLEELEARADKELDKNSEIIVYCASFECHASPDACKILKRLGFGKVAEYSGGIKDWMRAGYPLETRLGKNKV